MDFTQDYYKGIAKIYFNRILDRIIDFGNLKREDGLILDFGCGVGHLKKRLKGKNVVGYDIIPELTDISDYTKLKPSVIVCNAVLQYLGADKIEETLRNFKKMNDNAKLITVLPRKNWVSKIGITLTGLVEAHDDKLGLKDVNVILERYCKLERRERVFTMAEVSMWKFR